MHPDTETPTGGTALVGGVGNLGELRWVLSVDTFNAWAIAPDDYSQWENIAVAVLFFGLLVWGGLGFPGIPRNWLHDDWRLQESLLATLGDSCPKHGYSDCCIEGDSSPFPYLRFSL